MIIVLTGVLVVVVRTNLNFTKNRIRSHRYQVAEKFFLAPLGFVKGLVKGGVLD